MSNNDDVQVFVKEISLPTTIGEKHPVTEKQAQKFREMRDRGAALNQISEVLVRNITKILKRELSELNRDKRNLWRELGAEHDMNNETETWRFLDSDEADGAPCIARYQAAPTQEEFINSVIKEITEDMEAAQSGQASGVKA